MKGKPKHPSRPPLAAGQLWQANDCYVQIARVGKRLAEYKLLRKLGQRGVQSSLGNLKDVAAFLKSRRAKLIKAPASTSTNRD